MEDNRTPEQKRSRMAELMRPIEQQLLMCDDPRDQIMMACAMLVTCRDVLDQHLGEDGRRHILGGFV